MPTSAVPVFPAASTAFVVMTGPAVPFVMTPRMASPTMRKVSRLTAEVCRTSRCTEVTTAPVCGFRVSLSTCGL